MSAKVMSKEEKLKIIGLSENFNNEITDDTLDIIYNKFIEKNKNDTKKLHGTVYTKESKFEKVDFDNNMYKTTLSFLNGLLKALNKNEITDITQFKNIEREHLLNPVCNQVLDNHIDDIIKCFGKSKIRYDMRHNHKCYVLSVIKYMVTYCGYKFASNRLSTLVKDNTNNYIIKGTVRYHII